MHVCTTENVKTDILKKENDTYEKKITENPNRRENRLAGF